MVSTWKNGHYNEGGILNRVFCTVYLRDVALKCWTFEAVHRIKQLHVMYVIMILMMILILRQQPADSCLLPCVFQVWTSRCSHCVSVIATKS